VNLRVRIEDALPERCQTVGGVNLQLGMEVGIEFGETGFKGPSQLCLRPQKRGSKNDTCHLAFRSPWGRLFPAPR